MSLSAHYFTTALLISILLSEPLSRADSVDAEFCRYRGTSCSIERLRKDSIWLSLRAPAPRLQDDSGATLQSPTGDGSSYSDQYPELSLRHPYIFGRTFEQLYGIPLPSTGSFTNESALQSSLAAVNYVPLSSSALYLSFDGVIPNTTASTNARTPRSTAGRIPLNPFHSYTIFNDGSNGIAYSAKLQHPPVLTAEDMQKAIAGQGVKIRICSGGRALSTALEDLLAYQAASPSNRSTYPPPLFLRDMDTSPLIDASNGDLEGGGAFMQSCSLMTPFQPQWGDPIIASQPFRSAIQSYNESVGDYVCPLLPTHYLEESPSVGLLTPRSPLSHLMQLPNYTMLESPCTCLPPSLQQFILNASGGALSPAGGPLEGSTPVLLTNTYLTVSTLEKILNESVVVGRVVRLPAAPLWSKKSYRTNGTVWFQTTASLKTTNAIFGYSYASLKTGNPEDQFLNSKSVRTNLPSAPISDVTLLQPWSPDFLELYIKVQTFATFRLRGTPEVNNISKPVELFPGFLWANTSRELPEVEWNIFQREGYVAYVNITFVVQPYMDFTCNFTTGFQASPISASSTGIEASEMFRFPTHTFSQIVEVQLVAPQRASSNQNPPQPTETKVDTGPTTEQETAVGNTGGTVQVVGVVTGVPSIAIQMGVLDALKGMAQCNVNSDITQLPSTSSVATQDDTEDESEGTQSLMESPLQLGFGPDRGKYLRGTLIGNLIVGFVIFPVGLLLVVVGIVIPVSRLIGLPNVDIRSTLIHMFGFPSVFLMIFSVVLEGTAQSAMGLLLMARPDGQHDVKEWAPFDIFFSVAWLGTLFLFVSQMWYVMALRHVFHGWQRRPPAPVPSSKLPPSRNKNSTEGGHQEMEEDDEEMEVHRPMRRQTTLERVLNSFSTESSSNQSAAISERHVLNWDGNRQDQKDPSHVSKKGFPGVLLPAAMAHARLKQIEALEAQSLNSRQTSDESLGSRQSTLDQNDINSSSTSNPATGQVANRSFGSRANASFVGGQGASFAGGHLSFAARPGQSRLVVLLLKLITTTEVWVPRCLNRPVPAITKGGGANAKKGFSPTSPLGGAASPPTDFERNPSEDFYEYQPREVEPGEVDPARPNFVQLSLSSSSGSGSKTTSSQSPTPSMALPPLVVTYLAETEWLSRYAQYFDDSRLTWYTPLEVTVALLIGMLSGIPTSIMKSGSTAQNAFCVARVITVLSALTIQLVVSVAYKVGLLTSFHVLTVASNFLNAVIALFVVIYVGLGLKIEQINLDNRALYEAAYRAILAANPEVVITSFDQIQAPAGTISTAPYENVQSSLMEGIVVLTLIAGFLGLVRALLEAARFFYENYHQLVEVWKRLKVMFGPRKIVKVDSLDFSPGSHKDFGHIGDEDIMNAASNRAVEETPLQDAEEAGGEEPPEPLALSDTSSNNDEGTVQVPIILSGERGVLPTSDSLTDDESGTWSAVFSKTPSAAKLNRSKIKGRNLPVQEEEEVEPENDWQMFRHKRITDNSRGKKPKLMADGYFAPDFDERESVNFTSSPTPTSQATSRTTSQQPLAGGFVTSLSQAEFDEI